MSFIAYYQDMKKQLADGQPRFGQNPMLSQINGLHHVSSMAADAVGIDAFFTQMLGLRRVKKTVNFDAPDGYHLYYADAAGSPGSVMTYFPFHGMRRGKHGTGEVGLTSFSIPQGSASFWAQRLGDHLVEQGDYFGSTRLSFAGPDGDQFALIEAADDTRAPWNGAGIEDGQAIRGFHSISMRLRDSGAMTELLGFMGYDRVEQSGSVTRFAVKGNGADIIDLEIQPELAVAKQGAGSVHHVAFAVATREAQLEVRNALLDTGYQVTPVLDRDYFWSIYFRAPGGVLFEIATNEPGFDRDEPVAQLGQDLKLPKQHEHLRGQLEQSLPALT